MRENTCSQDSQFIRGMLKPIVWFAAAAVVCAWTTHTYGQTLVTWDGATGSYVNASNWNPDVVPSNAANEFLTINNGGTAQVVTGNSAEGAHLYLGLQPGQSGHLTINGGTMDLGEMRVGGLEAIPDLVTPTNPATPNGGGTGTVVQNGGTVNITYSTGTEPPRQSLWLGDAGLTSGNTANGSYTITGTEANPAVLNNGIANNDGIFVGTGVGSVASFTQNNFSTVTTTGFVTIGRRGSTGTWTMNGGVLNQNGTQGILLGDGANADNTLAPGSSGTFTQTGGDVNATSAVEIGRRGGTGVYSISAGTLDVAAQIIVASPTATAGLNTATGTFNVSGTAAVTIGTNLNVGGGSAAGVGTMGTLNMTGGSITLNGTGGTIFAVGNGSGATGIVNLSGGTINHTAGNTSSTVDIGRNGATATMNVSATGVLNAKQIAISSNNTAVNRTLNITGGTVDVDTMTFGTQASVATRLLDISGGTVNIGALTTGNAAAGGQALTHIHGGNVTLENTVTFFSSSVFRLSAINLAVPANSTYGNATIDVLDSSVLTLNGTFGTGADARTLTKTGSGTLTINGVQSYTTNAGANITGGTIVYNTDAGAGGVNLAVNANGGNATFGANQSLRQLDIAAGGIVNVGNSFNVKTNALNLDGTPQTFGLTFGSLASSAAIKSDTYFAGAGTVTLGLAGDYDISGVVDAADYVIWRENQVGFGGAAGYTLWKQNFGNVAVPGASAGLDGNQAVPEPGTMIMAAAGALLACAVRRRR